MTSTTFTALADALITRTVAARPPDFIVGGTENPYLLRWYLTPWRRWHAQARNATHPTISTRLKGWLGLVLPSVYLHCFRRDDDDRALHDHPWPWCSILLRNGYIEHTIAAGGIHRRTERQAPSIRIAGPRRAHRIELLPDTANPANAFETWPRIECWTLFITGPRVRQWGFHCPEQGWVHWKKFTAADDPGAIGPGCEGGAS